MKNKVVSGCFIIALVLLVAALLYSNVARRYWFEETDNGEQIYDSHNAIVYQINSMEKSEKRNWLINVAAEANTISQEEANELYNN